MLARPKNLRPTVSCNTWLRKDLKASREGLLMELVHMAAMDKRNSVYLHHRNIVAIYTEGQEATSQRT